MFDLKKEINKINKGDKSNDTEKEQTDNSLIHELFQSNQEMREEITNIKKEINRKKPNNTNNKKEENSRKESSNDNRSISNGYTARREDKNPVGTENNINSQDYKMQVGEYNNRDYNLVIYWLSESTSDDLETRRTHDYQDVQDMLGELGLHNIQVIKTSRIGKRKEDWFNSPRPLVVKLGSIREKWIVIGKGKFLKNTESFYGTYLALDMGKEELERNKNLRYELKDRRSKGQNVSIKNGQIVTKRKSGNERNFAGNQTYQSFQAGNNRR